MVEGSSRRSAYGQLHGGAAMDVSVLRPLPLALDRGAVGPAEVVSVRDAEEAAAVELGHPERVDRVVPLAQHLRGVGSGSKPRPWALGRWGGPSREGELPSGSGGASGPVWEREVSSLSH